MNKIDDASGEDGVDEVPGDVPDEVVGLRGDGVVVLAEDHLDLVGLEPDGDDKREV